MQKHYLSINEITKTEDSDGVVRFSKKPFGFMQHNDSNMDSDEIQEVMKFFYGHIFKWLWFNPASMDNGQVKWYICTDEDKYIDLMPGDRFLVDHKREQLIIERGPDFKETEKVWYGEPERCFHNHRDALIREVRSSLPRKVTREEMYSYATGCPQLDPIDYFIKEFKRIGELVYRKGDDIWVYNRFDDKTLAEVALEEIKWRNRNV